MLYARIYIVTCGCGTVELNSSRSYEAACHKAQAHSDLTGKCAPTIFADDVPAAVAA
jgi:hypothetical protein